MCIITFLCFNICGIIIQALGLLTQYYVLSDEKVKLSLVIVLVMEHGKREKHNDRHSTFKFLQCLLFT